MPLYNTPQLNGTGADEILTEVVSTVPIFTPMLLFFIFGVVMITGIRKQREATGIADTPLWATIAGVVCCFTTLILSTRAGLIDGLTMTITFAITIFLGIWLLSSRDK